MKKAKDPSGYSVSDLLGLGQQSARKSYHRELSARMEELEIERNRYEWLFENAMHGIFQASLQGSLRVANPAMAEMLGYPSVHALLEACQHFETLFCDATAFHDMCASLRHQESLKRDTLWLKGADGSQVPVAMALVRKPAELAGEDSVVEGFVADVTEREQARRHLEALNEHLEARVVERTRELRQLNLALKQARDEAVLANRSKDRYLAAASHDLLQPMNAARLLMASLEDRLQLPDNRDIVTSVQHSLASAEAILSDLLDIAKLDHGQIQPQFHHFSLDSVLDGLIDEFSGVAQQKGLQLRYVSSHQGVTSDPNLLSRLVRNFLANACRYTEHGGICLGVRRQGAEVLAIEVWDSGIGISEHDQQRIFEEFHQLNTHRARDRQGVGLGLAIVDRISQHLEHPVKVRSWPGRGSCFSVSLTRCDIKPQAARASATREGKGAFGSVRVLVIDNEPAILEGMALLLAQWGVDCDTALDVPAALSLEERPDALLIDLHLDDGVTGTDAIKALRRRWQAPDLPAAILSADRSPDWQHRLRQARLPLLNKPVRPAKLRALLSNLLGL